MLLPLILAVLDEILIRQRHGALGAGVLLGLLRVRPVLPLHRAVGHHGHGRWSSRWSCWWSPPSSPTRAALRRLAPHAAAGLGVGPRPRCRAPGLAGVVRARGPGPPVGPRLAQRRRHRRLHPVELRRRRATRARTSSSWRWAATRGRPWARRRIWAGASWPSWRWAWWRSGATAASGSSGSCSCCAACARSAIRRGQWEPARLFDHIPVLQNVIEQRFMAVGFLAAAVMLGVILDRVHGLAPDWRGAVGALAAAGVALGAGDGGLRRHGCPSPCGR